MYEITVIIPVYNVASYLKECLDSVVQQTYVSKEVLLIDDGSTDGSSEICDDYAAKYSEFRVIHKKNGGSSSARNRGIDEAQGRWLIFLDSDDVWSDKDCLKKLHSYANKFELDVVRFEYQSVNEKCELIESRSYDKSCVEGRALDNYEFVKFAVDGEWFTVLYLLRTDTICNLRFNERVMFQEDTDFYCRLFAARELRCGYIDERMYLYRKRTSSITTTVRIDNLKCSFGLCDVFYHECNTIFDIRLKRLYIYYSVMMYYWTLQTLASKLYYDNRKSIIDELHLNSLHKKVVSRINQGKIEWKYLFFVYPIPVIGVKLLHIKDKIRALLS